MTDSLTSPAASSHASALPETYFHTDSAALRFWVTMPDAPPIGATLGAQALHYRFHGRLDGADAVAIYQAHRDEIDAAVRRRVAAGSIEPVFLREHDVPPPRRA